MIHRWQSELMDRNVAEALSLAFSLSLSPSPSLPPSLSLSLSLSRSLSLILSLTLQFLLCTGVPSVSGQGAADRVLAGGLRW